MTQPHGETSSSPQSNTESETLNKAAANTRPSSAEQAEVIHYAYDPQTYEILCRPGQRLSEKKARRLQELGLYAQVVRDGE